MIEGMAVGDGGDLVGLSLVGVGVHAGCNSKEEEVAAAGAETEGGVVHETGTARTRRAATHG